MAGPQHALTLRSKIQRSNPNPNRPVRHTNRMYHTSYDQARHQYYSFTDIKNILNLTPSQNMLNFIKKINLYDQL